MRRLEVILALAFVALAWVKPAVPTGAKPLVEAKQRLDYLIVEVNGTSRVVRAGEELQLVRGDVLLIREASLLDPRVSSYTINLFGYQNPPGSHDDRGFSIATDKDLRPKYSEQQQGERYPIEVTSRLGLHGRVHLRLVEPVLRFAEVTINGQAKVMRDGEALEVAATDLVKVGRVSTNVEREEEVLFQIVPVDLTGTKADAAPSNQVADALSGGTKTPDRAKKQAMKLVTNYEIRFLRGNLLFARIPLVVQTAR